MDTKTMQDTEISGAFAVCDRPARIRLAATRSTAQGTGVFTGALVDPAYDSVVAPGAGRQGFVPTFDNIIDVAHPRHGRPPV